MAQRIRSAAGMRAALVVGLALFSATTVVGCGQKAAVAPPQESVQPAPEAAPATAAPAAGDVTELKIEDTKEGTGPAAKAGDTVSVHYSGFLTDGSPFDSSLASGQPFEFQLGAGQVIPGWDQGVEGMKVGGKRKLTIPPDLAYGAEGAGGVIPPNATLVFEVEMIAIK